MKSVLKINADGRMFDKDPDLNFDPYSVNSPLTDEMRKRLKTKENKNDKSSRTKRTNTEIILRTVTDVLYGDVFFRKYRDYIFFAGLIFAVLMIIFTF
jgi:hypothetical protein